jgi:hypothetical protein
MFVPATARVSPGQVNVPILRVWHLLCHGVDNTPGVDNTALSRLAF